MLARKIAGNVGIQILGKGATLAASMAAFSLLTRYLGPELYGRYNIILTIFGMTGIVADLGVGTIAIREIASGRKEVEKVFPCVLAIRLGLGLAAVALSAAIGWAFGCDRS